MIFPGTIFADTARAVRALLDVDVRHRQISVDPSLSLVPAIELVLVSPRELLRDRLVTAAAILLKWIEELDREAGR